MSPAVRRLLVALVLLGNIALVGYLALEGWLLTGWFLADSVAFRLDPSDWYWIALRRFALWSAVGLAMVGLAFLANRWLLARLQPGRPRLARHLAYVSGAAVLVGTAWGSAQFAITKPYL